MVMSRSDGSSGMRTPLLIRLCKRVYDCSTGIHSFFVMALTAGSTISLVVTSGIVHIIDWYVPEINTSDPKKLANTGIYGKMSGRCLVCLWYLPQNAMKRSG